MATWGEFIKEFNVVRMKSADPQAMYVVVDQVLDLWEERNKLRAEVALLSGGVAAEREGCAREVEEFADACAAEGGEIAIVAESLRMAANMIRDRANASTDEETEMFDENAPAAEAPAAGEASPFEGMSMFGKGSDNPGT